MTKQDFDLVSKMIEYHFQTTLAQLKDDNEKVNEIYELYNNLRNECED